MTADPFRWQEDGGHGLRVERDTDSIVAHEVMYEDELTRVREKPMFVGTAIPPVRLFWAGGSAACVLLLLLGRAFSMQVVQGKNFQALAERNRLRHDVVQPRRGIIRDRNGKPLAENMPAFDVRAIEQLLPSRASEERVRLLGNVARLVGTSVDAIEAALASSTDPYEPVVVRRDVPYERALAVELLTTDSNGIDVVVSSKRRYDVDAETLSTSHVLGYLGGIAPDDLEELREKGYRQTDIVGKTGVEATYESYLRGIPGERLYEVDAKQRVRGIVGDTPAIDGEDVVLSLDNDLQRAAEKALQAQLEKIHLRRGAVVAINPQDGSILAAVSLPAYNGNIFAGTVSSTAYKALLDDPDHPLLPRAWAGVYPSGSTVKPVVATAALTEHVITPETTVLSTGGVRLGPWFFPDWKAGGHGVTNVRKAIAWSVNTFFYTVGGGYGNFVGLGVDRLTAWYRKFGLGAKTGIDVPGEGAGFVPSREWKQKTKGEGWFVGDTYNLSIGQGDLLVTPLHVARYTAMIANGGYPITPHFAWKHGRAGESQVPFVFPRAMEPLAPRDVIETVRAGMRDTVIYGSGRSLSTLAFPAAGKTGTAQWRSDKANHAWFTCFAPFDNPQIAVTVLIEEGVEGSSSAVPVAKQVLQAWADKNLGH